MTAGQIHTHTRASDGDVTPEMIVQAGLGFVAITDHDTLGGVEPFRVLEHQGIEVISGVEVTVTFAGRRLHVLVLEPVCQPGFLACLERLQEQRRQRLERIIAVLTNEGLQVNGLDWQQRAIPTRRDVIDVVLADPSNQALLADKGLMDARIFGRYFFHRGNADIHIAGLPAEEVLSLVQGVFVLAHPAHSLQLPADTPLLVNLMRRLPFVGIEVITRKHTAVQQALCADLAHSLNLIPVTSNDAHTEAHLQANHTPYAQMMMLRQAIARLEFKET